MLDRAFGPGQGIVSVDVLLNFDHVKVTSEEVLPARGSAQGSAPSGVMVRERQTQRETPAGAREGSDAANAGSGVTNIDVEYQAGRRIEQIVSTPGSVRRINVGVVVPRGLSPERLERIRELVAVAAGLDKQRGDAIAVYSLDQMSDGPPSLKPEQAVPAAPQGVPPVSSSPTSEPAWPENFRYVAMALVVMLLAAAWRLSRRRPITAPAHGGRLPLAEQERAAMLQNLQNWLEAPVPQREQERS